MLIFHSVDISMAMDIGKLDDELLERTINQLPALDQVAVSRVSRRFTELALKTTTVMDVRGIPCGHRLDVAQKMPKLVLIFGLGKDVVDDLSFAESLAKINKNIVHLRWSNEYRLVRTYIESAKKIDTNYTGSRISPPLPYEWYQELTSKYPDLEIKCDLDLKYEEEYNGNQKCDLAVRSIFARSRNSSRITSLLNRTINVSELAIKIKPDNKKFTLFPVLDTIAKLKLTLLTLVVKEFKLKQEYDQEGKPLNLPLESDQNKKYSLSTRDFSSLQKVLSIDPLRSVYLYLDCVHDVQSLYHSFMKSSNNNFNAFRVEFQSYFVQSQSNYGNIRYNRGYVHEVKIDSLHDFNVVEFVQKFRRSPARCFSILCNSDNKWNEIKTDCEQFTKSRTEYRFTLRRIIGEHLTNDSGLPPFGILPEGAIVETVNYNL